MLREVSDSSDGPLLSLINISDKIVMGKLAKPFFSFTPVKERKLSIELPEEGKELWIQVDGKPHQVKEFKYIVTVEQRPTLVPLTAYEYKQELIEGALAWVASAKGAI